MNFYRPVAAIFLAALIGFNVFGFSVAAPKSALATSGGVAGKYIRTELYFGLSRKGGPNISEAEFQAFIDELVTPRFPSGFTVLDARGQWREDDGTTTKERTKVLIVIYRRSERQSASSKIEEIRSDYKRRFSQRSVLRWDQTKGVDIDF